MSEESEALSLYHSFSGIFDSMAKLFEARAANATKTLAEQPVGQDYFHGRASAFGEAAHECRIAADKLREP